MSPISPYGLTVPFSSIENSHGTHEFGVPPQNIEDMEGRFSGKFRPHLFHFILIMVGTRALLHSVRLLTNSSSRIFLSPHSHNCFLFSTSLIYILSSTVWNSIKLWFTRSYNFSSSWVIHEFRKISSIKSINWWSVKATLTGIRNSDNNQFMSLWWLTILLITTPAGFLIPWVI